MDGGFLTPEYSSKVYLNRKWEENSGIDIHSYGLNRNTPAKSYWSSEYLIHLLIRSVANGGNLLLDIGPAGDGSIPTIMQERLLDIGAWLSVNGKAIYSTRKWRVQSENSTVPSSPIYYTAAQPAGTAVYAIATAWPGDTLSLVSPVFDATTQVTLIGVPGPLKVAGTPGKPGLTIQVPQLSVAQVPSLYAWAFQLLNVS